MPPSSLRSLLPQALRRRKPVLDDRFAPSPKGAARVFSGAADGLDGVYIDVYGPGAVLILYEGRAPKSLDPILEAPALLELLAPLGVQAVYMKPFAKDRSKLGGELPPVVTDPTPAAGEPLPEAFPIREHDWLLEIRLFDGLSTGLFLDQRENRKWVADGVARRIAKGQTPRVLNTFAYTGAFSVAAAKMGAVTASVDVSGRYLDWAKRNFELNHLDPAQHRFAKMDTFEFLGYAARKSLAFDLIILDPPSFASGNKKKGIKPWSSVADYARLIHDAAALLAPGGAIFASTNTTELCRPGRLQREVCKGLGLRPGAEPRWLTLPPPAADFASEDERFAALAFSPKPLA